MFKKTKKLSALVNEKELVEFISIAKRYMSIFDDIIISGCTWVNSKNESLLKVIIPVKKEHYETAKIKLEDLLNREAA